MDANLIHNARSGDTIALDAIMQQFKPLVKAKAKAYFLLGGDLEDLIQEGMIGLYKAVLDFDATKANNFAGFASLCVVRQIQTAIKLANRQKHMPLNTSLSLHNQVPSDPSDISQAQETYLDKLPDNKINDPEALFLGREAYNDIGDIIKRKLSEMEYHVLMLHMDGKSHLEIATALNKNGKSVDNTLQRIRRKIREELQQSKISPQKTTP